MASVPEVGEFRTEARAWLAAHVGPYRVDVADRSPSLVFADVSDTAHVERGRAWQREVYDAGYAGLGWPREHGGRDLPVPHRVAWAEESLAAGAPPGVNLIGESLVGPALIAHGTEAQRRRYLRPILSGEEVWCQLFSEPGAGSDMAAVRTSATRAMPVPAQGASGGEWRLTGHKLWASAAHYADFGLALARSDWDVPKHEGCTCFMVDMRSPGVTVRPLRQMTGGAAFNEVFLDSVAAPDSARVGDEGEGWPVARTALWNERLNLALGVARIGGGVERILRELAGSPAAADPLVRQVAAQLYVESRCVRHLGERAVARLVRGRGRDRRARWPSWPPPVCPAAATSSSTP